MGYLISSRTAEELKDLIARKGSILSGSYRTPRDLGGEADETLWAFNWSVSASTCTITEGVWQIGSQSYAVAQGTVTLSGATEYVYAFHKKNHSSSGFGHSSTLPNSAGDEWRIILVKLAASGSTWAEAWTGHKGNIILSAPTA